MTENYNIPAWGDDGRTNDGELDLMAPGSVPFQHRTSCLPYGSIASMGIAPNPAGGFSRVGQPPFCRHVSPANRGCSWTHLYNKHLATLRRCPAGFDQKPVIANGLLHTILLRNDKGLSQAELVINH